MIKENYFSKKLSCGSVLDYSAEFFRGNLKPLVIMTLIFHAPIMAVCYALMSPSMLYNNIMTDYADDSTLDVMMISVLLTYLGYGIMMLYQSTLYFAYAGGVTKFTYEKIVNGETMKTGKALKFGFKKFGWMILYQFILVFALYAVIIALYFIIAIVALITVFSPAATSFFESMADNPVALAVVLILIVLGIFAVILYFAVRLSLVLPAIMIDNCDCITAIKRSFSLTKKRVFRTFWTAALGTYVINLASSALTAIASLFVLFEGSLVSRICYGVSGGISTLVTPLVFIIPTIIFINAKKQNGDIDFEQRIKEV